VQIENLRPLPTREELRRLPEFDTRTGRLATRKRYELFWTNKAAEFFAERFAGSETVWRTTLVPAGKIDLYSHIRRIDGETVEHRMLARFTLKAGESKVVRLR